MLPALATLKNLIKTKSYHIDLPFFRLHYQATVTLLLAFCLILTAKVLFGDTIDCMRDQKASEFFDNICYSIGTFTRYKLEATGQSNSTVIFRSDKNSRYLYTGILLSSSKDENIRVFWHSYYQYVPVILFIQAILFYLPHYMWKLWEGGTISSVCKRLHENRFAPNEYFDTNYDIVFYLQSCTQLNKSLVYKYYFCHVLCLLNLVLQIIALNVIFNYQFISYGYLAVRYLFDDNIYGMQPFNLDFARKYQRYNLNNPMDLVFPKITSCHVEIAGEAGKDINNMDFMCVLPLNILHDKFFLLLWFWFLILLVLTILQIIYDLIYTFWPYYISKPASTLTEAFLLNIIGHNSDKFAFQALLRKMKHQV